jgi:hypothetical protein
MKCKTTPPLSLSLSLSFQVLQSELSLMQEQLRERKGGLEKEVRGRNQEWRAGRR